MSIVSNTLAAEMRAGRLPNTVLLLSGRVVRRVVMLYGGACLVGQATAYVIVDGIHHWVKRGESVDWVEVEE